MVFSAGSSPCFFLFCFINGKNRDKNDFFSTSAFMVHRNSKISKKKKRREKVSDPISYCLFRYRAWTFFFIFRLFCVSHTIYSIVYFGLASLKKCVFFCFVFSTKMCLVIWMRYRFSILFDFILCSFSHCTFCLFIRFIRLFLWLFCDRILLNGDDVMTISQVYRWIFHWNR